MHRHPAAITMPANRQLQGERIMRRIVFAGLLVGLAGLASSADGQPDKKPETKPDDKKPAKAEPGYLEIRLPPNASLAFDNYQTRQRAPVRYYMTPPLVPGHKYTYELTAAWQGPDGKPQKESKKVNVNPGETIKVQFGPPPDEKKPKDKDTGKPK